VTQYLFYNYKTDKFLIISALGLLEALIKLGYEPGARTGNVAPYITLGEL
jgi:hypothetical protein